jgi:radical SAM/Cys-rich protein
VLAGITDKVIVRSNLTNLVEGRRDDLMSLFRRLGVAIVASFPSANAAQLEAQRGRGALEKSIAALRKLNALGYGQPGSGLTLDLVSNPSGAFLPPCQKSMEKKLRLDLQRKWGIVFNNLLTFANVPLGRFRKWLVRSGNFEKYINKLASSFNPATVGGLMCRGLISVSWDGHVYDCDFNQAAGIPLGGSVTHISDLDAPPPSGARIAVSNHCYACTAGSGFT